MRICYSGGKQAGIIGLLTILACGHRVISAVSYSDNLTRLLNILNITNYSHIGDERFIADLRGAQLLINTHGREIFPNDMLRLPWQNFNLHPNLYDYKGARSVERGLKDGREKASVGSHVMTDKVDCGEVLFEEFIDVRDCKTVIEIYNKIYPLYASVMIKTLKFYQEQEEL